MKTARELIRTADTKEEFDRRGIHYKPFLFQPLQDFYQIETQEFEIPTMSWGDYLYNWIKRLKEQGDFRIMKEYVEKKNYSGPVYSIVEILKEENE